MVFIVRRGVWLLADWLRWVASRTRARTSAKVGFCSEEVIQVSNGPIEFARDPVVDDKGPTEYGGRAGLIQGGVGVGEEHVVTASEARGLIVRGVGAVKVDPVTGLKVVDETALAVDPATGLEVGVEVNFDGAVEKPVEAPPKTGNPDAGVI